MYSPARTRRGLSIVEFVACLTAMVGGVILGSMYLGVDVKHMALALLYQTQLIDRPSDAKATADDAAAVAAAPATDAATRANLTTPAATPSANDAAATNAKPAPAASTAESPAASPASSASAERAPAAEAPPATAAAAAPAPEAPAASSALANMLNREDLISLTDEQRRTLTLAYWQALDTCTKEEVANRLASISADGNFTLFNFLTCRKQGHQRAVDFISQLDLRGVDPHVAAYAEKDLAWHKDGVTLFSRALDLLTDAPTAQFTGPFAQSWQNASTQHQMEERLLAEKHQAVQDYLDHSLTTTPAATAPATATPTAATVAAP